MEMGVGPAHTDLEDVMQLMQAHIPWHHNPPPDRRLYVYQLDVKSVRKVRTSGWHGLLLLVSNQWLSLKRTFPIYHPYECFQPQLEVTFRTLFFNGPFA